MGNTKLTRGAAVLDRVLKILQGFAIAGVAVAVIFIPLTLILGTKIIASASSLDLGVLELTLGGNGLDYLDAGKIKLGIIVMLVGVILTCAAVWYGLRVLRGIVAPMKEAGTPFAAGVAGKIRTLAWTVLIGGAVAEIARVTGEVFQVRAYQLDRLLNMDELAGISYDWKISIWFVAAALILFFLSYVFRCGEALQKESDETL